MARIDHIAYRTADRYKSAQFFVDCLGYKIATEFPIVFDDGSKAECLVLEPPEKENTSSMYLSEQWGDNGGYESDHHDQPYSWKPRRGPYHLAPEIFISDGTPDSIVGRWVAENGPGVHHMAYQVSSVEQTMKEWREAGYAEFSSDPIVCHDEEGKQTLKQVFTKPSSLTGIVYELIERGADGFCKDSVAKLIESTKNDLL